MFQSLILFQSTSGTTYRSVVEASKVGSALYTDDLSHSSLPRRGRPSAQWQRQNTLGYNLWRMGLEASGARAADGADRLMADPPHSAQWGPQEPAARQPRWADAPLCTLMHFVSSHRHQPMNSLEPRAHDSFNSFHSFHFRLLGGGCCLSACRCPRTVLQLQLLPRLFTLVTSLSLFFCEWVSSAQIISIGRPLPRYSRHGCPDRRAIGTLLTYVLTTQYLGTG